MARKSETSETDTRQGKAGDGPSFEAAMEELESLIDRIESGQIGLEESIKAYERGVGLVKRCRAVLDQAEQRVEELSSQLDDADEA